jgi:hypothetical protein
MMQLHLEEISRNVAQGAHAVLLLDRAGWHTTSKLDVPDNITPIFLPSRAPELKPGRERLAISPPELALQHRVRKLRRHHRRCMRRLAKAHRSTRNDHIHRNARLASRRSLAMTSGISIRDWQTSAVRLACEQKLIRLRIQYKRNAAASPTSRFNHSRSTCIRRARSGSITSAEALWIILEPFSFAYDTGDGQRGLAKT